MRPILELPLAVVVSRFTVQRENLDSLRCHAGLADVGVRQKRLESTGRNTEHVVQRTRGLAQCDVRSDFVELLRMWVEGGQVVSWVRRSA